MTAAVTVLVFAYVLLTAGIWGITTYRTNTMLDTLADAIREAYRLSDGVQFEGAYRRSDIGKRALQALK